MKRDAVAAADKMVNIAGDGAVAAPARTACWVTRRLLLHLCNLSSGDGLREAVGLEMLMTHPPSLTGGEATARPCRLDQLTGIAGEGRHAGCDVMEPGHPFVCIATGGSAAIEGSYCSQTA